MYSAIKSERRATKTGALALAIFVGAFACGHTHEATGTPSTITETTSTNGQEPTVDKPEATVPVANAEKVVAGFRSSFKRCYQEGLAANSDLAGKVKIVVKIAPDGGITSVENEATADLPPSVVGCLRDVVRTGHFDAPGGKGSTINIPVTFVKRS